MSVTGLVDFYAGMDFSQDQTTYAYVGTEGGYVDGEVDVAEFKYPVSIALSSFENNLGVSSGVLYVADRYNDAIRRVANVVATPSPTASFAPTPSPTRSLRPTPRPTHLPSTSSPTKSMHPTATYSPSHHPTPLPSISAVPTFNPTKRPTHSPTKKPTKKPTPAPTKVKIVVEDVSLFHSLGLGTYHVTTGALILSTLVGLLVSGVILAAYFYRNRYAHMRLRTTDMSFHGTDTSSHDDGGGGGAGGGGGGGGTRSQQGVLSSLSGLAQVLYDSVCVEDACVSYATGDDVDTAVEMSEYGTRSARGLVGDSNSSSGRNEGGEEGSRSSVMRLLQNIREQSSHSSYTTSSTTRTSYLDFDSANRGSMRGNSGSASPMVVRSLGSSGDGL